MIGKGDRAGIGTGDGYIKEIFTPYFSGLPCGPTPLQAKKRVGRIWDGRDSAENPMESRLFRVNSVGNVRKGQGGCREIVENTHGAAIPKGIFRAARLLTESRSQK